MIQVFFFFYIWVFLQTQQQWVFESFWDIISLLPKYLMPLPCLGNLWYIFCLLNFEAEIFCGRIQSVCAQSQCHNFKPGPSMDASALHSRHPGAIQGTSTTLPTAAKNAVYESSTFPITSVPARCYKSSCGCWQLNKKQKLWTCKSNLIAVSLSTPWWGGDESRRETVSAWFVTMFTCHPVHFWRWSWPKPDMRVNLKMRQALIKVCKTQNV